MRARPGRPSPARRAVAESFGGAHHSDVGRESEEIAGIQRGDGPHPMHEGGRHEMSIVDPRSRATRDRQESQEDRQDGSLLWKQADGLPEFSDVLESIGERHPESVGSHQSRRHYEVFPNHLCREYERLCRLDQGHRLGVKATAGVGCLDQDVGVEQQGLSDRRPRR